MTNSKVRVLIVDDSSVVRRLLSEAVTSDPSLEVISTASNGKIALEKIEQQRPDVVTLDVEMPVMDGLQTLREIRAKWPRLPVIMFSTLTERGARTTLDALLMGASDYATKPSGTEKPEEGLPAVVSSLVPKIKALCRRTEGAELPPPRPFVPKIAPGIKVSPGLVRILAIGVSTGGPQTLEKVIPRLPADFGVPVVIVQHMPKIFTRLLADRLSAASQIPVRECVPGTRLAAGEAWIAPGDFHMVVKKNDGAVHLETTQDPPENSCRPAVDVLFRSVASTYAIPRWPSSLRGWATMA